MPPVERRRRESFLRLSNDAGQTQNIIQILMTRAVGARSGGMPPS